MQRWGFLLISCCFLFSACTNRDTILSISPDQIESTGSHAPFPDDWFFYEADRPASLRGMEGKPAPKLSVKNWLGQPLSLEQLQGQVVIVDFWATWCGPCVAALPENVALVEKYSDQGLTVVGVHDSQRGYNKISKVAKSVGVNYPLCVDAGGKSTETWNVEFWPTYFLIDQHGIVRAAGLNPSALELAVVELLGAGDELHGDASPRSPATALANARHDR